jgi:hypothetical protein
MIVKNRKPIIRWTMGDVLPSGFVSLRLSIKSFIHYYGDEFRLVLCYNNINPDELKIDSRIELHQQTKTLFQGSGSVWKLTPPRLDTSVPELFVDNDIVFARRNDKVLDFLKGGKFLMCEDHIPWYGKYNSKIPTREKYNAGLFGLPEGYDFEKELVENWKAMGSFSNIESAEEQGLTVYTLKRHPHILLKNKESCLVHPFGTPVHDPLHPYRISEFERYYWSGDMHHFCQLNRTLQHKHFIEYNVRHL